MRIKLNSSMNQSMTSSLSAQDLKLNETQDHARAQTIDNSMLCGVAKEAERETSEPKCKKEKKGKKQY